MAFLGIDIGGTGIKAGIVDHHGRVLQQAETPTRARDGADGVLARVDELAHSLLKRANTPVEACGVGSAGRIDCRRGRVVFASGNLPGWTGLELGRILTERIGLPVVVDNDVNAAAVAEGWIGAARSTSDYLMVTIGTGVGGALVIGGKVWRGSRFGAGEVGHMCLYPGGLACNCGGTGCAEQYISAKALTRRANEHLEKGAPFRGIRDVLTAAERGPLHRREPARKAVQQFTDDLAIFLVNLQNLFDPPVVIIGGGIVRLGYWWDLMVHAVGRESRPRSLRVRLKRAYCGPQAGVVGAARLAMLAHARTQKKS